MKLLVVGTDVNAFSSGSETEERVECYGRLFQELHIIVYTPRGFKEKVMNSGTRLYPTNSSFLFLRPFDAWRLGRKIIAARGIDLISVQDPAESGLAGLWLKWASGVPLHVQIHADICSPFFRKNSWKERLRYLLMRLVIPCADKFRVVSERIRYSLLSAIPHTLIPITVLPIFVDRERIFKAAPTFDLHKKYPQFDFIILMVARLVREKNIRLALRALAEVRKNYPRTGLVIVGDGPEKESLKFKVKSLKLDDSVRFDGWQSDLVSYYKTADVYLLTSNFEGYGRSVVEAAAAGLPIVMTDVGVAGEIIKNNETGIVVPVGDKNTLVSALARTRRDYPLAKAMAAEARELVLKNPPLTFAEYLASYRRSFDVHN